MNSKIVASAVLLLAVVGITTARLTSDSSLAEATETTDSAAADGAVTADEDELATPALGEAPPVLSDAPQLVNLDGWLNTDTPVAASGPGPVRIVQFWTFGCYNCKATLPHLQEIYAAWQPSGLEIIGVHSPEFSHEKEPDAIAAASDKLGVTWPIGLDTEKENFRIWQGSRRFWPRTYVVDQNGAIRFDHIGEGAYDELAATVAYLIENGP